MKVHLVQMDIAWERKRSNHDRVLRLLERAAISAGDLILLPEMFDTGFSLNVNLTADGDGMSQGFLADLARSTGCYVQGGITVLREGRQMARNRSLTLRPDGSVLATYDKIHPFSYGREPERFEGGNQVMPFHLPEARLTVCPSVCYDLRFPELFRVGLDHGAAMFTVIANWPAPRRTHWRTLLEARAIENQAIVAAVNRTGSDPHLAYAGDSMVVGPRGEILVDAGESEGVYSCELDGASVGRWRREFPAWRDRKLRT